MLNSAYLFNACEKSAAIILFSAGGDSPHERRSAMHTKLNRLVQFDAARDHKWTDSLQ